MTLSIGTKLNHYIISSQLGKGGMGEVYQAKDQKLGRDVAIKVLPEEFAEDTDRVARFQREAKLLASLNHPNIAAIHGLEESDGTHFLVLELIEGDTLADRVKRGAIPVEEALKLALQIAEALEAAHEKGVIHRDLKPANIKVTPDGNVKVLDFGLAKAFAGGSEDMNLSNSPTLSVAATQKGIILGTAAYMSPEQASGEATDKRTDIWAFGVVLFEMLTGRSLFEGNNVSQTLASVIKSEPEWQTLPPNLHPRIRLLLERCLEKESKNRYHDIADARVDVQKVLSDPSGVFAQTITAVKPRKKPRVGLSWVATAIILSLIVAGIAVWYLKPTPPQEPKQVTRFNYELPEGQQISPSSSDLPLLAVSPDGSKFAYCTNKGIFLRSMNELDARLIAETDENSIQPFFSPDGQWIGYWSGSDQKLKKVAISGGVPVTLCDANSAGGFSWSLDNRILHGIGENIMWVSANGGNWEPLIEHEDGLLGFPQMLPGGEAVMYLNANTSPSKIVVQSLKSGESKELFEGTSALYIGTGHIVYGVGNSLNVVPFDIDTLEVTGGPISLVEGVLATTYFWHYAISDSGTLVYIPGTSASSTERTLVWVDRKGNEEPIDRKPNDYRWLELSPDGTNVALSILTAGRNEDIWIYDLVRGTTTRLTFDERSAGESIWTPGGERIIFGYYQESYCEIYLKSAAGTGKAERIASVPGGDIWPESLLSDGNTLLFGQDIGPDTWGDIGMLTLEGDHTRKLLLQEEHNEGDPRISPDGRWLAYVSDESGNDEVYVRPFPDIDKGKWTISTEGGDSPLWSPDGRELFYRSGDSFMAVEIETEPSFSPQKPTVLFEGTYASHPTLPQCALWDIHPSGKKFLMLKPFELADSESTQRSTPKINIVLNWFEELKERLRTD